MWGALLLLGLLGYAGSRVFRGYPPRSPTRALAPREMATLDAVSETMFPPGGAIASSGCQAGVAAYVDQLVAASQPQQRRLMRALFFLIEHGTLCFPAPGGISGMRRFSSLPPALRTAVIDGWRDSRLFPRRLVFTTLRALCTLGYFSDPAVLRTLRLAPYGIETPIVEADLLYPRIGARSDSVQLTPADLSVARDAAPLDIDGPLREGYAEELPLRADEVPSSAEEAP